MGNNKSSRFDKSRFDVIAQSYENALKKCPNARTDAQWLLDHLEIKSDDFVLEISAGTGYLTQMLARRNPDGLIVAQDIASEMLKYNKKKCSSFKNITYATDLNKIKNNYFNKAVSLGGWHHMEDQVGIIQSVYKKLKPDGIFCVGDFVDNSSVQKYFDNVIHKITKTGHKALFPSESRMLNLGRFAGFANTKIEQIDVPFYFDDKTAIGNFFQEVHALEQAPLETYRDIKDYYYIKKENGKMAVMMPYVYAKYTK